MTIFPTEILVEKKIGADSVLSLASDQIRSDQIMNSFGRALWSAFLVRITTCILSEGVEKPAENCSSVTLVHLCLYEVVACVRSR